MTHPDPFPPLDPEHPSIQENWLLLMESLKLVQGFGLYLVGCPSGLRLTLLVLLNEGLAKQGKKLHIHTLKPNAGRLAVEDLPRDHVILVRGLDAIFDNLDLRDRFLSKLNQDRDLIRSRLDQPLILLMDADHLALLELGAADFFSVHRGYFRFLKQDAAGVAFLNALFTTALKRVDHGKSVIHAIRRVGVDKSQLKRLMSTHVDHFKMDAYCFHKLNNRRFHSATHGQFAGRIHVQNALDQAHQRGGVVVLHGPAGIGKSVQLAHWLSNLKKNERAIIHELNAPPYSMAHGLDLSLNHLLVRLGLASQLGRTADMMVQCVLENLADKPRLLILDGLEVHQHTGMTHHPKGQIQHHALHRLIAGLTKLAGLCIVTTRIPVIGAFAGDPLSNLHHLLLEPLTQDESALLFEKVQTQTSDQGPAAMPLTDGNPLNVSLLATLSPANGKRVFTLKETIAHLLNTLAEPRGKLLFLLASCQAGAPFSLIQQITPLFEPSGKVPVIPPSDLVNHLKDLQDQGWVLYDDEHGYQVMPELREEVMTRFQADDLSLYLDIQKHLFQYYSNALKADKNLYKLDDLFIPLSALGHGCNAQWFDEAFDFYTEHIQLKQEYLSKDLKAHVTTLNILARFFEVPYCQPHGKLSQAVRAACLYQAGQQLQLTGRVEESLVPLEMNLSEQLALGHRSNAAHSLLLLGDGLLAVGDLKGAEELFEKHAELLQALKDTQSTHGEDLEPRMLHYRGDWDLALALFEQRFLQTTMFQAGLEYHFSEFLIDHGEYARAQNRLVEGMRHGRRYLSDPMHARLESTLLHARSYLVHVEQDWKDLEAGLDPLLERLRSHGNFVDIANGLLIRARISRRRGRFADAQRDLTELWGRASFGGMRLLQVECCLEWVQLYQAQGDGDKAQAHLVQAQAIVRETGYNRRKQMLAALNEDRA